MHLFFVLLSMVKYFIEPPANLFDRIILAIKKEQELRKTKRLLFGFLFLLIISVITTPLSWMMFVSQVESSGLSYYISAAINDLDAFILLWKDFSLVIFESLPFTGIIAFMISLCVSIFTLRLFLYKKRLLLGYLVHNLI